MRDQAESAITAILARAAQPVAQSNNGADIAATLTASRARLGKLDTAGALSVLAKKIEEEETARRQRLIPLYEEQHAVQSLAYQHEAARSTLRDLITLDPDNPWHWFELGDSLRNSGASPEALTAYRNGQQTAARLAQADPAHTGWQRDLSVSHNKIGDVQTAQGNLPAALASFQASLTIRATLAKADPDNAGWQRDLSVSHERIGGMHAQMNQTAEARRAFAAALVIYEMLIERNPGDVPALVYSVIPRIRLAELDPPNARKNLTAGLAILKPLAEDNRLDARRQTWIPDIEARLAALGP